MVGLDGVGSEAGGLLVVEVVDGDLDVGYELREMVI